MILVHPKDEIVVDTATLALPQLLGFLKFLAGPRGRGWRLKNGDDCVVALVRAIRARCFRDRARLWPSQVAKLNQIDPPNCRCGKPGTRIQGSVTFCASCGPSEKQKAGKKWIAGSMKRGSRISKRKRKAASRGSVCAIS